MKPFPLFLCLILVAGFVSPAIACDCFCPTQNLVTIHAVDENGYYIEDSSVTISEFKDTTTWFSFLKSFQPTYTQTGSKSYTTDLKGDITLSVDSAKLYKIKFWDYTDAPEMVFMPTDSLYYTLYVKGERIFPSNKYFESKYPPMIFMELPRFYSQENKSWEWGSP